MDFLRVCVQVQTVNDADFLKAVDEQVSLILHTSLILHPYFGLASA